MSLLSEVADALRTANPALAKKEAELESKRQRLEFLKDAPLSKSDEKARYRTFIDSAKAQFTDNLEGLIERDRTRPLNDYSNVHRYFLPLLSNRHVPDHTPDPDYLLAVFGDHVMEAVEDAIDGMDWPIDTGPSPAERQKEIAKLEPAIKKLENDIRDMRTQVRQVGATSL